VRSFAGLKNREADYTENVISQFVKYSGVPVVCMEGATGHPLQSFADVITIEEYKKKDRPKVVLTWAPHPRSLPQAVPNSFVEWVVAAGYEVVVTQPKGYELNEKFTKGATIEYDQNKAFKGADFIYAKNWSSYNDYGKILSTDRSWTVDSLKMGLTNDAKFMHCLPVRRNMIVSDEVIDSVNSIVIEEAENRIYSAQTVIKKLLEAKR
jgi:N-succinyl-L-ornithine transcarbamylase